MARTADDPLLAWRDEFPITQQTSYLISNSLGAMPRRARASVGAFLDQWETRGVRAWAEGWWEVQDEVAGSIERILGVPAASVSMHQNVAMASQAIVSAFAFERPRNRIVLTELDFPSVMYLYEAQARRGAEVVRVPGDAEGIGVDTQRLVDAIDDRTLLVSLHHVLFRTSFVQDVRAVVAKARAVGAVVVLDVFQSVGTLPLKLREWGVHAAVGGALKFLCGGAGNCFLYVDPDLRPQLQPTFTGWAAHRQPFAFSNAGQDYRTDGGRFLNGTPNVPALFAGRAGIRVVEQIGAEAIRQKSQRQTAAIVAAADRHGFRVRSARAPELRAGHVALDVTDGYEVCQQLCAEDIVVDWRPNAGIRIAPHFYTRDEECVAVVDRIAAILGAGTHLRFKQRARRPG